MKLMSEARDALVRRGRAPAHDRRGTVPAKARDPKLAAVRHFLTEHRTEGRPGSNTAALSSVSTMIRRSSSAQSSQSYCQVIPWASMRVRVRAVYFAVDDFASVEREGIKAAVKKREIRLLVATDDRVRRLEFTDPRDAGQR